MAMGREIKVLLVTGVVALVLVAGLYVLKTTTTPERSSSGSDSAEEIAVEEHTGSGGAAGSGDGKGEKGKLTKKKVDPKQNLLDAIYDEDSSKQMKDHLKRIRESSR